MKTPALALLALLTLGPTSVALAQPASQPASQPSEADKVQLVEQYYAQGAAMFQAGAFKKALEKFEAAYKLIPVSNLLYNIGRCHEALGHIDAALDHYKRCMDHPEASKEAKLRSAQRYEMLVKARVDGAKAAKSSKPPAAATAPEQQPAPTPAPASGGMVRTFRWITLGLGVALAVAGGVTYAAGVSDHDEIESLDGYGDPQALLDMTRARALELRDSGTTKKTVGVALFGAAGAALVTSTILFLVPDRERSKESDVAVTVAPDPRSGAHILVRGTF